MSYQSIIKKDTTTKTTTGYKSIFSNTTPVPVKQGEIVNRTLPDFLGGGTYKMKIGDPNWKAPTQDASGKDIGHSTYGGVPTKTGYERADIFPVSLSGVNASSTNITMEKNLPEFDNGTNKKYRTATDKYLGEVIRPQLDSGKIDLRQAQVMATSYLRNQQEGVNTTDINKGRIFGQIADKVVGFFEGINQPKQPKQPEISTQQLAKNISERPGVSTLNPSHDIKTDTGISTKDLAKNISQSKEKSTIKPYTSIFKQAEFNNQGMVASKLQLPENNWAFKTINTIYNVPSEAVANLVTKETKLASNLGSQTSPLKRVVSGVETATAILGVIPQWLAFSTGLEAAKNVPIVKYPAKGISFVFEKLGQLGSYAGGKAVDIAPVSDDVKAEIRPAVEELSALAVQLLGAKKGADVVGKFSNVVKSRIAERQSNGEEITPKVATDIVNEVKSTIDTQNYQKNVETLAKDPTPENLQKAIDNKPAEPTLRPQEAQGGTLPTETTIKTSEIKTIKSETTTPKNFKTAEESVAVDKEKLLSPGTIKNPEEMKAALKTKENAEKVSMDFQKQLEDSNKRIIEAGDQALTADIIARKDAADALKTIREIKSELPTESQLISEWNKAQDVKTPKETFIPKLAQSNRQKAIDLGVKPEEFTKLPEVEKIHLEEQVNKATEFIKANPDKVNSVLRGEEPVPNGTNYTNFLTAAERYLKEHPSKDLAYEIANSELTKSASLAGQEVVSAKLREPDSFTAKIIELKKSREPKIKDAGKNKAQAKKSLKEETTKINLKDAELSWDNFLDKITC